MHVDEGGFIEHYLPYMLTEESLLASGHLPKFRENLYGDSEEDYFFVPTAEASFANLYRDEILPPGSLPMRFVAHTPCFRREKMSAGRGHARAQAPASIREGRNVHLLRPGRQRY